MIKKTSLSLLIILILGFMSSSAIALTVESVVGDQDLIIDGVQYSAKSTCYGFQIGDQVELPFGNTDGNCTETLIYNLRNNESCDAWCQYPL